MSDAEFEKCKRAAMILLGYSAKSGQDLFNRLTQKGYSEEAAAKTLAAMTEYGYIDDQAFAERRVQALLQKNLGERAIRWKLQEHGISDEIIENVIQVCHDQTDERLYALARQYYVRGKGDHKTKLRYTSNALWQKGHDQETIAMVIERINEQESE